MGGGISKKLTDHQVEALQEKLLCLKPRLNGVALFEALAIEAEKLQDEILEEDLKSARPEVTRMEAEKDTAAADTYNTASSELDVSEELLNTSNAGEIPLDTAVAEDAVVTSESNVDIEESVAGTEGGISDVMTRSVDQTKLGAARERLSVLLRTISQIEKQSNFLCGIDGSSGSDMAFQTALSLMGSKDGIIVLHAFDAIADEKLPSKFYPDNLKSGYEMKLSASLSSSRWQLKWVDKQGSPLREFLLKTVNSLCNQRDTLRLKPSYFVSGYNGRKNDIASNKVDSAASKHSLSMMAAGKFYLPNIIVKNEPPKVSESRTFVAAVKDPQDIESELYDLARDLMKPKDKLICIHVYKESSYEKSSFHEDESDAVIKKMRIAFEKKFEEDGLLEMGSKFVAIVDVAATPVHQLICDFMKNTCAPTDFLVIQPHLVPDTLGGNCIQMIRNCPSNIVVGNRQ